MSFEVFPSNLIGIPRLEPVSAPQVTYPTVQAGSVAAFRQRFANGHIMYNGAALPYPASLPTSGINPAIVEFRQGSTIARDQQPNPHQSGLVGYVAPAISTPTVTTDTPSPAASVSTARRKQTRAARIRRLVVPVLPESIDHQPTPYLKEIVERVAFNFSQQPLSAAMDEDVVKEVRLDGEQEFFDWLKVQRTLQNWLDGNDIDMPAEAKKARETVAAKREAEGRK